MGWACASGVPLSSVGVTGGCGSIEGSFTVRQGWAFRNCSSRCRWAQDSDGQFFWFMRGHDFLICPPGADSVVFLVIIALGTGGLRLQCLDNFWRLLLSHVFAGASCVLVLRRSRWWPCLHASLFFFFRDTYSRSCSRLKTLLSHSVLYFSLAIFYFVCICMGFNSAFLRVGAVSPALFGEGTVFLFCVFLTALAKISWSLIHKFVSEPLTLSHGIDPCFVIILL